MVKYKDQSYFNTYESVGEDIINREDVWHFYVYFAGTAAQLLQEFTEIADMTGDEKRILLWEDPPVTAFGKKEFQRVMDALALLIDYYKYEGLTYKGNEINFEHGDIIPSLTEGLHLLMNILPYLNGRHYTLSRERYDEIKYHLYSYDELNNLDCTLARTIFPTFLWFVNHSIFCPRYFKNIYHYPRPRCSEKTTCNYWDQWNEALDFMVSSWEWLKDRTVTQHPGDWEDVPDEIYYGLHLFAEYLPEMQND